MKKISKCNVCSFKVECDGTIDKCLKCGASYDNFKTLSDEESKKIYASDRTNDIHCKIIENMMEIKLLCEEGIKISLDNNCVQIFDWIKDRVWDSKELCKTEILSHINSGKW